MAALKQGILLVGTATALYCSQFTLSLLAFLMAISSPMSGPRMDAVATCLLASLVFPSLFGLLWLPFWARRQAKAVGLKTAVGSAMLTFALALGLNLWAFFQLPGSL